MSDHAHMLHYTYVWSLNLRAVATVCSFNIMYIVIFVRYRYTFYILLLLHHSWCAIIAFTLLIVRL